MSVPGLGKEPPPLPLLLFFSGAAQTVRTSTRLRRAAEKQSNYYLTLLG